MRLRYFGDSFDIVKQSLLRWLSSLGPWAAHPMFTESVTAAEARGFSRLLGVPLISSAVLVPNADRSAYFAEARGARTHLFLDPDTGLRMQPKRGTASPAYLFAADLEEIATARPGRLTLVFDQSYHRADRHGQVCEKLAVLRSLGLYGIAYVSHATFLIVSDRERLICRTRRTLLRESLLPADRLIGLG